MLTSCLTGIRKDPYKPSPYIQCRQNLQGPTVLQSAKEWIINCFTKPKSPPMPIPVIRVEMVDIEVPKPTAYQTTPRPLIQNNPSIRYLEVPGRCRGRKQRPRAPLPPPSNEDIRQSMEQQRREQEALGIPTGGGNKNGSFRLASFVAFIFSGKEHPEQPKGIASKDINLSYKNIISEETANEKNIESVNNESSESNINGQSQTSTNSDSYRSQVTVKQVSKPHEEAKETRPKRSGGFSLFPPKDHKLDECEGCRHGGVHPHRPHPGIVLRLPTPYDAVKETPSPAPQAAQKSGTNLDTNSVTKSTAPPITSQPIIGAFPLPPVTTPKQHRAATVVNGFKPPPSIRGSSFSSILSYVSGTGGSPKRSRENSIDTIHHNSVNPDGQINFRHILENLIPLQEDIFHPYHIPYARPSKGNRTVFGPSAQGVRSDLVTEDFLPIRAKPDLNVSPPLQSTKVLPDGRRVPWYAQMPTGMVEEMGLAEKEERPRRRRVRAEDVMKPGEILTDREISLRILKLETEIEISRSEIDKPCYW